MNLEKNLELLQRFNYKLQQFWKDYKMTYQSFAQDKYFVPYDENYFPLKLFHLSFFTPNTVKEISFFISIQKEP